MEYWTGYGEPAANVAFKSKLDTDLFEFAKNKTRPLNLTVSPGGKFLAAFSADKKVFFQIIYYNLPTMKASRDPNLIICNFL